MPSESEIQRWHNVIRTRYENYLKTSFYFKDTALQESFAQALRDYNLMRKENFPESARSFQSGNKARDLAKKYFGEKANPLLPALRDGNLYSHQEKAIRLVYEEKKHAVVATGTASGKTESFLYPILFELYRQHLAGELQEQPGVRALILYPMNALANDQRQRLGKICEKLAKAGSKFQPTFGQYIGETPEDKNDRCKDSKRRGEEDRLPNELIFRKEMRKTPPHILLTNYSMLEYLLIRPDDSPLFDKRMDRHGQFIGMGRHWQFIVLDEAHQYRGVKGMEMGMLIRRLKQRLRAGGRGDKSFRCIATSATISSDKSEEGQSAVAEFAGELFGEKDDFSAENIVFGKRKESEKQQPPSRFHLFMRALEGAFLVRENGADKVVLNRIESENSAPLEIALCGECGQHYYVGQVEGESVAKEAIRDPSHENFGVDFYLPLPEEQSTKDNLRLCRRCGKIGKNSPNCDCGEADSAADLVPVKKCVAHKEHKDQLKKCEACGYSRGSFGDPVREIVHGTDGPNVVIATALHGLLSEENRKILAFADNRQEAAFFAWYAQNSYEKFCDRNLIWRALTHGNGEVSLDGLANSLWKICDENQVFPESEDSNDRERKVRAMIYREAVTDQRRISLEGVGLAKWHIQLPAGLPLPQEMLKPPWNFTESEARLLIAVLLDDLRIRRAVHFPVRKNNPHWKDVSDYDQFSVCINEPKGRKKTFGWSNLQRSIVGHFLVRLLPDDLKIHEKKERAQNLMRAVWKKIHRDYNDDVEYAVKLFLRADSSGGFHLNLAWLRVEAAQERDDLWQCGTCEQLHFHNVRDVCRRNKCSGKLVAVKVGDLALNHYQKQAGDLAPNHYRKFYEDKEMPIRLKAEEHTAQIKSGLAQERQKQFIKGEIHLLSSSTTFELGVDLGDLEVVFLRNVPPEPFNYAQRAGRAGRRDTPGLALTYCRRNPHDLYHYADPKERILEGKIRTPTLRLRNEKIIRRHIAATALSAFFRENRDRFTNVKNLVGDDWGNPRGREDFQSFCEQNRVSLETALRSIVPEEMHAETGLAGDGSWIEKVAGKASRFAEVEMKVCKDYNNMERLRTEFFKQRRTGGDRIIKRLNTIAYESALMFLSRQTVIPKYGFPVDVVELDTPLSSKFKASKVSLQRDLSQAIAEYAPGSKVVANKWEWESYGVKMIPGKELRVMRYEYDEQHNFKQWEEGDPKAPDQSQKYLWPQFGFVPDFFKEPKEPQRRAQRLYTTRPYFVEAPDADTREFLGVKITQAVPGKLVVLCEGKNGRGFHICLKCGAGFSDRKSSHKSPNDTDCKGTLYKLSLGHEFVTDVTRLDFPGVADIWEAYSLAYAVLLGAASALEVPDTDLNATITGSLRASGLSIVLYDNVPGGAGLVANLYEEGETFREVLEAAKERVKGECGCDSSCYGCLRSYRNQFAHPYLQRGFALRRLEKALEGRGLAN